MQWDNQAVRGGGVVVYWMRDRWFFASLVALDHEPLSPTELLELFQEAHDVNTSVFGVHSIYKERVTRHLGTLAKAGLIEAEPRHGRHRTYRTSALGSEMLGSVQASARFGRAHYEWLVAYARLQQHLDPDAPIPGPAPGDQLGEERMSRRALALLWSELLAPKWTYATLTALTVGQLRFSEIVKRVNVAVDYSSDVVSGHLADSALSARLEALQMLTLVDHKRLFGRSRCYALTTLGRELVASLEPAAQFGIRRDAEMTAAASAL